MDNMENTKMDMSPLLEDDKIATIKQVLDPYGILVVGIYGNFITNRGGQVSEKGVLQVLLDLRFIADILSGGDFSANEGLLKSPMTKYSFRRKQNQNKSKSVIRDRVNELVNIFAQRLDPIDWLTYEPYLWENERQSYLRYAVLFGFFVQLNRMYTDIVQKLPTNSESNIMRCSTVPRFKYLPISAPALSSRGATKAPIRTSSDDISMRSPWKAYANGDPSQKIDFDDNSTGSVAAPFLKSFMQIWREHLSKEPNPVALLISLPARGIRLTLNLDFTPHGYLNGSKGGIGFFPCGLAQCLEDDQHEFLPDEKE
ncbi:hypothetical protein Nepgr_021253 [Nepenthes gracilis]|uniref:Conserved oligomeric Golgi complex subunit 1 n=1 Tax=Nepenthes gracilis TaxID=150966 RepID=A0AAD3SZH9_NEPGR|nr:hypothetical protein Nepgr_021253 [Nepenthes gracilis]